jgi:serine/threonine protein phosphatase 1
MRQLAIGDIHGCFRALITLEAFVPVRRDDVLITLGDYVDRGPDSCAVLDWLLHRHRQGSLIALRGNHEVMMLAARDDSEACERWLLCGGVATLASYSPFEDAGRFADIPDAHWDFLAGQTRPWFESARHFFVHANAYPDCPLDEQPDLMLYWETFNNPPPHESGKIMVCGHTPQKGGLPRSLGHAVCIDTGAYGSGWLTCLDVQSGRYWQANQRGQTRRGWLETED